jgi:hypothetical protein
MKKVSSLTALGFMFAILFAIVLPARADDVDQRIRTLEEELARLKVEQTQVKAEQIELKKNALAAEGALPTFSYRAGNGLLIEAADKSWSLRTSFEAHMRMNFEHGLSHAGRTQGEVMGRRFRPRWNFCVANCFYEIEASLDLDGFGTNSALQRGVVWVHLEQVSPWLPTVYFGMDGPASTNEYRQGSSSVGSQMDYDLLSRSNGFNTGRFGNGIGLNWDDKPLDAIGIPGRISRINLVSATIGEGDDGQSSFRDTGHNFATFIQIQPFSQVQSKWIQGLGWSFGAAFCDVDKAVPSACNRLQIRDNGDGGRQSLFDTGTIGRGWSNFISPGFQWEIGPYRLRVTGAFNRYSNQHNLDATTEGRDALGKVVGHNFLIGHDLYVWGPKGWWTGSSAEPGSVLFGTHFERNDVDCNSGKGGKSSSFLRAGIDPTGAPKDYFDCGNNFTGGGPGFNRNTILVREWDMWYFLMARASIGVSFLWYDTKNMSATSRHNFDGKPTNIFSTNGINWYDVNLNFRYTF